MLPPPIATGMMWSYSRRSLDPQVTQRPSSRLQTNIFVESGIGSRPVRCLAGVGLYWLLAEARLCALRGCPQIRHRLRTALTSPSVPTFAVTRTEPRMSLPTTVREQREHPWHLLVRSGT